ncbi:MAG: SMP-30/gluconolactonase/LRE family protein [Rhizobiaceae bacterium]
MSVSILSHTNCALGEGPSYDARSDTVFWFDINNSNLHAYDFATGQESVQSLPFMASAIFSVDAARQLILSEHGLHMRDRATGALTLHYSVEADNPNTRSNDARAHACGAIWFGTMGKDESAADGKFYHYFKGKLTLLIEKAQIPNSICFSPDGATAYYVDTPTHQLMRVAIDPLTALPTGKAEVHYQHAGNGWVDGSVCDADGNIWNARWGTSEVACISPQGKVVETISIPGCLQTSCPAFVGLSANHMIVTSASKNMDESALKAAPQSGKTFLIDAPFKGRLEPDVLI